MLQVCTLVTELHSFLSHSELSIFFVYIIKTWTEIDVLSLDFHKPPDNSVLVHSSQKPLISLVLHDTELHCFKDRVIYSNDYISMSIVFTANTVRLCKELRGTPDNLIEETLEVLKIVIPHVQTCIGYFFCFIWILLNARY